MNRPPLFAFIAIGLLLLLPAGAGRLLLDLAGGLLGCVAYVARPLGWTWMGGLEGVAEANANLSCMWCRWFRIKFSVQRLRYPLRPKS
jgi:hypothetical protein